MRTEPAASTPARHRPFLRHFAVLVLDLAVLGAEGTSAASSTISAGLITKAERAKTATEATNTKTGLRRPFPGSLASRRTIRARGRAGRSP